jgi:hypothetical protein
MGNQETAREYWEDAIRDILGKVPDELLDSCWRSDMTAHAAADYIEGEMNDE